MSVGSEIFSREPWKCPLKKSIGDIFEKVSEKFLELFLPALFDLFLDFSAIISLINIEQNIISKLNPNFFLRETLFTDRYLIHSLKIISLGPEVF